MYDGEPNVENIDNWIRQMEFYCPVQQIDEEKVKIQLFSLHLEGTTLIWWEGKPREGIEKSGKILSSW
jgi:hypothetical protein